MVMTFEKCKKKNILKFKFSYFGVNCKKKMYIYYIKKKKKCF